MADTPNTWMDWFGKKAWENKEAFFAWVRAWFSGKNPSSADKAEEQPTVAHERGVLVIGPGGVGKSTFGKLISGDADLLFDLPQNYDESVDTEIHPTGAPAGTGIIIPPGQERRRPPTWPELFQALAAGKFRGVIFVVAYGYHNHEIGQGVSYKEHPLYRQQTGGKSKQKFLMDFLAVRRQDEMAVLKQLMPYLIAAPGKSWFLTLVTKQDLWWNSRSEVEEYYRDGEYGSLIAELAKQKPPTSFKNELVLASMTIRNFKTGRDELLQPNTAGYDLVEHGNSLISLFKVFDSLREWDVK